MSYQGIISQTVGDQAYNSIDQQKKGQRQHLTYKEIFTALRPVEPFHHSGGLHLLPLHTGDAAQLHGIALHGFRLRGYFHTHREADSDWREDG